MRPASRHLPQRSAENPLMVFPRTRGLTSICGIAKLVLTRGNPFFCLSLPQAPIQPQLSHYRTCLRWLLKVKETDRTSFASLTHSSPMSSRSHPASVTASSSMTSLSTNTDSHVHVSSKSRSQSGKAWVDPASLPDYGDISTIAGNAPDYVKQLNSNTFFSYGVGDEDCFGHQVGKAVKFVDVSVDRKQERQGRLEATTVAEVHVSKREFIPAEIFLGNSTDRPHIPII